MRVLSFYLVLFSVGGLLTLVTDATDFFELYPGINVWARSSFRLRRETSIEECARTCAKNDACSSFVYSRVTKYCYGRRKVDFTSRRHWHLSRRYDFYRKITGRDQRLLERRGGRRDEVVFVMRSSGSKQFQVIIPGRLVPPTTTTTTRQTTTTTTATTTPRTIPATLRFRQSPPATARESTPRRRPRPVTRPTAVRRRPVARPAAGRRRPITRPTQRTRTTTVRRRPATRPSTTTRTTTTTTRKPTTITTTTPRKTTTTTKSTAAPTTTPRTRSTAAPVAANRGNSERCERAIGLEDGSFPYNQITASSYYWRYTPSNVGINTGSGWMASTTEVGEYIEIDFGGAKSIVAVATQGSSYLFSSEYVSEYKLRFLFHPNGIFETYKENGQEKIFIGNSDSLTIKKNRLSVPVRAYKVQFHPLKFYGNIMMRAEVYEEC